MDSLRAGLSSQTPVLVTGASGFSGSVLVRKLCALGLDVRAIARASSNLSELSDLPIRWYRGDVFDPETVKAACEGVEYIFHVAAAYREAKISDETYRQVHVASTQLLAQAALANPNFKRFVHVSTVGVHGHIDNPPADETYRFSPGDVYQKTKLEAELWIRDFARERGLPISVIRPAAILGPGDRRLLKVFRMAEKPFYPVLGYGKCLYHLIHVEDLTDAFILAATHPNALGEVFICGNSEPISLFEIVETVAQVLGTHPRPLRLPAAPFFLIGALCEALCRPFGIEPPIYPRRVAFFTKDRAFNTSKLRERLGFQPRWSNQQGLVQTAEGYLEQGWL